MGSSFGQLFRISTFGESHGGGVGVIVDGCPPRLPLDPERIQHELNRRKPGQSRITTPRREDDRVEILSGVLDGQTLGTPIAMLVRNKDQRPGDYKEMAVAFRPSHADATYQAKYGIQARSGGGRASARETIGRVAAGAIAEKWLRETYGTEIVACVSAVGDIVLPEIDPRTLSREQVDATAVRCPDPALAQQMTQRVLQTLERKDSIGGILTCVCRNVPVGLGEPVFDKLDAKLAQAMLSLPATKGFEIGSGFAGTCLYGSQHNDPFVRKGDGLGTLTNNSGGVQGGISNGEPIVFRVAFKPVATIGMAQDTVDIDGNPVTLEAKGRHDPCVVPRAVPIVETMTALVLMDLALRQRARTGR